MKLVIITSVEEFKKDIIKMFKQAGIGNFSSSEINGYKSLSQHAPNSSWFPSVKGGNESYMFFSFTQESEIKELFKLIKDFNTNIKTNNPIKGIVLPIESHI